MVYNSITDVRWAAFHPKISVKESMSGKEDLMSNVWRKADHIRVTAQEQFVCI